MNPAEAENPAATTDGKAREAPDATTANHAPAAEGASVLERAAKAAALEELAPGIAHELNNPLAAIAAFAELVARDPRLPEDLRGTAGMVRSESDRVTRIVESVLDFARQRPPERHPTALRTLVDNVVILTSNGRAAAGVEVEVDVPDDLPLVELDRQRVRLVLVSLVADAIGAIRASGRPGRVRIMATTDRASSEVRLSVAVDRIAGEQPAGPGLSVGRAVVGAHGGRLWSEPVDGGGTTVVIALPTGSAPSLDEVEPAGSGTPDGPPRPEAERPLVLVLDDEPSIRLLLSRALRSAGFRARVVEDGPAAVAALRDEPGIAAVLCDHRMAGMTGVQVFAAVVAERPDLAGRFVFMTGDASNPELRSFAELHGTRVLAKPFDLDTVARVVRRAATG